MTDSNEEPTAPDQLPDELIAQLDALDIPALKAVESYVAERIELLPVPLEAAIEAEAAGEIIDIEEHDGYALVRQHPPEPDGSGVDTTVTSLYHVRRERYPDGGTSLHWAYLGDVHKPGASRCPSCGRSLDEAVSVCPHCGSTIGGETEED